MRTALYAKFPDHQGKYREFHRFRAPECDFADEKGLRSLVVFSKFPTKQIREFQNVIRELFCGIREFLPDNREGQSDPVSTENSI